MNALALPSARPWRLLAAVAIVAAAALGLAGCAPMGYGTSSSESGAAPAQDASSQTSSGSGQAPGANPAAIDRQVVTSGSVSVTVEDLEAGRSSVEQLATSVGGYVESRYESSTASSYATPYATLTLRLPADRYDGALEEIRALGDVTSVSTSTVDVTLELADTQARVDTLQASVDALRGMMGKATTVADMLALESEISTRQTELDGLRAQLDALKDDVAMSTLEVRLAGPGGVVDEPGPPSFFDGLAKGWGDLVRGLGMLLAAIGYLLPGLILLGLLGVGIWMLVRWLLRRRRAAAANATAQPEGPRSGGPSGPAPRGPSGPAAPAAPAGMASSGPGAATVGPAGPASPSGPAPAGAAAPAPQAGAADPRGGRPSAPASPGPHPPQPGVRPAGAPSAQRSSELAADGERPHGASASVPRADDEE